jgi:hypothetical protein
MFENPELISANATQHVRIDLAQELNQGQLPPAASVKSNPATTQIVQFRWFAMAFLINPQPISARNRILIARKALS